MCQPRSVRALARAYSGSSEQPTEGFWGSQASPAGTSSLLRQWLIASGHRQLVNASSDLIASLIEIAAEEGHSVYFLGGRQGVVRRTADACSRLYPDLWVAGISSRFDSWSNPARARAVADTIRESGTDLLIVTRDCPDPELFLSRYLSRTGSRVGVGLGTEHSTVSLEC